ncbi:pyridoxamine 5'-phosphate oxidase family protein [Luteolibacter marinus]|uniref:pyridoxamine 5'-phosphate oxidase family protein n=1 Tax=Luteolibacter marinus TaxID=2776705 RepID=UPI00186788BC|nr:pyridoxamine 5'-phosphate oxidase family protein [Luteolibacter marinus]
MNDKKNLLDDDGVKKLRDMVDAAPTCMFGTKLSGVPMHVCPMQVQQVDRDGGLWFFSGGDSAHNKHIEADPRVQLIFCNGSDFEFLTVYGQAEISRDPVRIDDLWNKLAATWFPGGQEDPNLTLIRVAPFVAHYWETKDGKLVTIARLLTSAATGHAPDIGVEGDILV